MGCIILYKYLKQNDTVMVQSSGTNLYCVSKQIEITKQRQLSYVAHLCDINDLAKI